MENFKTQIAEVLFDSSVKLSKDALLWAMSNLPDNKNIGKHTTRKSSRFNHDAENVYEAVGISEEKAKDLAAKMAKQIGRVVKEDVKVSNIVEGVMDEIEEEPEMLKLIVVKTVQDALEHAEGFGKISEMAKMMKFLKKLKDEGGFDENDV